MAVATEIVVAKVETILMNTATTKVLYSVDFARNLATKKLNARPSRKMESKKSTLLRTLQERVTFYGPFSYQ